MAQSELPAFGTRERAIIPSPANQPVVPHSGEVYTIMAMLRNIGSAVDRVDYTTRNLTDVNSADKAQHQFTITYGDGTQAIRSFVSLETAMQPVFQKQVGSVATTRYACQIAFDGTGA